MQRGACSRGLGSGAGLCGSRTGSGVYLGLSSIRPQGLCWRRVGVARQFWKLSLEAVVCRGQLCA